MSANPCPPGQLAIPCDTGNYYLGFALEFNGLSDGALAAEQTLAFRLLVKSRYDSCNFPDAVARPANHKNMVWSPQPNCCDQAVAAAIGAELDRLPASMTCYPDYVECCWRTEATSGVFRGGVPLVVGDIPSTDLAAIEKEVGRSLSEEEKNELGKLRILLRIRS